MSQGDVETYFEDGRWRNRIEGGGGSGTRGSQVLPGEHRTLSPAFEVGAAVARNLRVEHRVRTLDGQVRPLRRGHSRGVRPR